MLEIEQGQGNTEEAKALGREISREIKKKNKNNKNKRDFKVIIDQKDFEQNLKKHQLKNQREEIKKNKVKLKETIKSLKLQAYIQMALGIALTISGVINMFSDRTTSTVDGPLKTLGDGDPYFERTITKEKVFLNRENYIHILCMLIGIHLIFKKQKIKTRK